MLKFIAGFVLGLLVASVGFSGLARLADKAVDVIQKESKELAK